MQQPEHPFFDLRALPGWPLATLGGQLLAGTGLVLLHDSLGETVDDLATTLGERQIGRIKSKTAIVSGFIGYLRLFSLPDPA